MFKKFTVSRIAKGLTHPAETARTIRKDLAANIALKFGNGYSPPPELIVIALSNRCNLHCQMCPQWGRRGTSKQLSNDELNRELTAEIISPFIEEIAKFKPYIHLTGGETLLARESRKIISLIKAKHLKIGLTTNGTLLTQKAASLVELGVNEIVISIDGTEAVHDHIRNVKGTFARVMSGIEALATAKKIKHVNQPTIVTQTTISSSNMDCLPELVALLANKDVDIISLHHLEFTTPEILNKHLKLFADEFNITSDASWSGLPQVHNIETDKLLDIIKQVRKIDTGNKEVKFVPNFTDNEISAYYHDPNFLSKQYSGKCIFPWKGMIIYPNGDMIACPNYKVGNIANDTFDQTWNGQDYKRLRVNLKKRGAFPMCAKCCWFYYHSII